VHGHQHVIDWIDQQAGESDDEEYNEFIYEELSLDSYGGFRR